MSRDDAVIANDAIIHNCRVDADQAIIADGTAMYRAVMSDGTVGSDICSR